MKCIICGEEIKGRSKKICSDKCAYKDWYERNKLKLSEKRKVKYIPSDRKKLTEEEKKEHRKAAVRKYRETHRESAKEASRAYHERHKNDEEYKEKKRNNSRRYYQKHKNDKI